MTPNNVAAGSNRIPDNTLKLDIEATVKVFYVISKGFGTKENYQWTGKRRISSKSQTMILVNVTTTEGPDYCWFQTNFSTGCC